MRRPPDRREHGAAAVEFALLFPVFAVMVLGMISAGFAFERWISVTQGVREASRFGATLSLAAGGGSSSAWLDTVSDQALASTGLRVDATHGVPDSQVCVALISPGSAPAIDARVTVTMSGAGLISRAYATGPCPDVATTTGNYVQVAVARPTDFSYVVGGATIQVRGSNVSQYEATTAP